MEIRTYNHLPEKATVNIDLIKRLLELSEALDNFLNYLKKQKLEIYDDYLVNLERKIDSFQVKPDKHNQELLMPILNKKIPSFTNLHKKYLTYAIHLLNLKSEILTKDNISDYEVFWSNQDKSGLYLAYNRALTLCDMLGRAEAINFLKQYVEHQNYNQPKPNLEAEDLDIFWETWKQDPTAKDARPSQFLEFRMHKGKWGGKTLNCHLHEVSKSLNDPELSHLLACYGDKSYVEAQNPNIVFTRTKTLIQGDPYCDACLHDKRHVESIDHPNEAFFQNLSLES